MGTSAEFWRGQTRWPRDTPEMVFMARAAIQLGKTLVDGWTGEEFTSEPLLPIDRATDARTINNIIARHLPQFGRREYRFSMAPVPIGESGSPPPTFTIPPEERRAAEEHIQTQNSKVAMARDRKRQLQNAIADLAVTGKLSTQYRIVRGGGFSPIPVDWWNTERLEQRFAFCEINPDDPFGSGGGAYIFLSRADLDRALAPQQRATISQETQCQNWLEVEFAKGEAHTQKEFQALAVERFGIGHNAFFRAWDAAVKTAPSMSRPGRRPKRPTSNGPA